MSEIGSEEIVVDLNPPGIAPQLALALRPEQGPLIPGGGGLRKPRWASRDVANRVVCGRALTRCASAGPGTQL